MDETESEADSLVAEPAAGGPAALSAERVTEHVIEAFDGELIDASWASAAANEVEHVALSLVPEG